ncbi:hypothetical protein ABZU94_32275 [Streptomyces mirabilis]|uniref:hypothetical protein n=1 Tax=Streptomyces sp. NPDC005388 TaxID=3156717 RepID=UPI0033A8C9DB
MHTPAAIAQLAAGILGSDWKAERYPWDVLGILAVHGIGEFTLHVDDHAHLVLEAMYGGEIARFTEPPTQGSGEEIALNVAEAIRQYLSTLEDDDDGNERDTALYQELNRGAHFSGADYSDQEWPCHPSVTIAGATAYFYIDDAGILQVSMHLDALTAIGNQIWGEETVPMQIVLEDEVLFSSIGTWVVQFQHPEDGGDDGMWEYAVPTEEAPTEASARTVATERFLADLNSRENADAWNGTTIRSVRLTDHPLAA